MKINRIVRPEDVLKNDQSNLMSEENIVVRKGTLKAVIDNINFLNEILPSSDSEFRTEQIKQAFIVIDELSPSLKAVKFFEFFTIDEWLSNENNHGRILVALIYLSKYIDLLDNDRTDKSQIIGRLNYLKDNTKISEIQIKIKEILIK